MTEQKNEGINKQKSASDKGGKKTIVSLQNKDG